MGKRIKKRGGSKKLSRVRSAKPPNRRRRSSPKAKITQKGRHRNISDARLERGLRVLSETKDIKAAARSIHVSVERFARAARNKKAIRKLPDRWSVPRSVRRRVPVFSNGRALAITVRGRSASSVGRYMSAVSQFLRTNDPKYLAEFKGLSVRDVRGKIHKFETDPNTLYRLASGAGEPFEDIYRIVI
jgi:hypothetical protein